MKYIAGRTDFKFHNTVVSLGKFDGLHRGHQLLVHYVLEQKRAGYRAVMFTFLYHPGTLFSDKEIELIYTEEEKKYLLEQYNMDVLISYPFTEETAGMEPEAFIKEVLIEKLDARKIVVGSDYCFGHNRKGNVALLKDMSKVYGYELAVFDKLEVDGQVVSSSYIRSLISNGDIRKANELLGRPYSVTGEVQHGRKIGRTLGFPTTNLIPEGHKLLPPNGVYVSKTKINGAVHPGITNIGYNPTVGVTPERRVETFLFDFDEDLYGSRIEVSLYDIVRKEVHFNSVRELKEQIARDITFGREFLMLHEVRESPL